jgi:hypothetical protein
MKFGKRLALILSFLSLIISNDNRIIFYLNGSTHSTLTLKAEGKVVQIIDYVALKTMTVTSINRISYEVPNGHTRINIVSKEHPSGRGYTIDSNSYMVLQSFLKRLPFDGNSIPTNIINKDVALPQQDGVCFLDVQNAPSCIVIYTDDKKFLNNFEITEITYSYKTHNNAEFILIRVIDSNNVLKNLSEVYHPSSIIALEHFFRLTNIEKDQDLFKIILNKGITDLPKPPDSRKIRKFIK